MGKKQIRAANRTAKPHEIRLPRTRISNHKPRKGTETLDTPPTKVGGFSVFQTTNPARGRKRPRMLPSICRAILFQTTNPARGRKLEDLTSKEKSLLISNHKPRKGTETMSSPHTVAVTRKFQTTNPARGRKRY